MSLRRRELLIGGAAAGAGADGPSTSLSEGGWPMPRSGGVPPVARNRDLSVSTRIRSARSGWLVVMLSKAAKQANDCLAAGPGVSTPAWWAPWNG